MTPPINVRQIIRRTRCFGYKILKLLFGRCLVRISAWPSAVLAGFFFVFFSTFRPAGIILLLVHAYFLPFAFQFIMLESS
jgi:hypothetical protein